MRDRSVEYKAIARAVNTMSAVARLKVPSGEVTEEDHHRQAYVVTVPMGGRYGVEFNLNRTPSERGGLALESRSGDRIDTLDHGLVLGRKVIESCH